MPFPYAQIADHAQQKSGGWFLFSYQCTSLFFLFLSQLHPIFYVYAVYIKHVYLPF